MPPISRTHLPNIFRLTWWHPSARGAGAVMRNGNDAQKESAAAALWVLADNADNTFPIAQAKQAANADNKILIAQAKQAAGSQTSWQSSSSRARRA